MRKLERGRGIGIIAVGVLDRPDEKREARIQAATAFSWSIIWLIDVIEELLLDIVRHCVEACADSDLRGSLYELFARLLIAVSAVG